MTLLAVAVDGVAIESQGFTPDMPAFELGPPHSSAHPLDDQAPLQFPDCTDDDNNGSAQGAIFVMPAKAS